MTAELLIGPVLRHVGRTDATVWVETSVPCTVEILGHGEPTWTVAGHHYALVEIAGLAPGSDTRYEVHLDGERTWPHEGRQAPSYIRTLADDGAVRLAFGSCRFATRLAADQLSRYGVDALDGLATRMMRQQPREWPTAMLMLGDQVYADHLSKHMRRRVQPRRPLGGAPHDQVADFEEYTWLYHESWTDPEVRWLLSNMPCFMIFDDHDVHDDWNTSDAWRVDMRAKPWWHERITSGLMTYWIYQHIGNLTPGELANDELYQQIRTAGGDGERPLREFAAAADEEVDGGRPTRWSYRRDFGDTRVVVIDSRCGRILDDTRKMVSDNEFDWITDSCRTDQRHLVLATSVPWLLAPPLDRLETLSERLASGDRGPRAQRFGEWARRAADLEHWAAFPESYQRLSSLVRRVADGRLAPSGTAPASVTVLSGDVHHGYAARVHWADGDPVAPVHQLTCSPMHNYIPLFMRGVFRALWSRALHGRPRVGSNDADWTLTDGPFFGNLVATLRMRRDEASVVIERGHRRGAHIDLYPIAERDLNELSQHAVPWCPEGGLDGRTAT
ncbi:alkaline phosphatase D family protein [Tsukamurella sp. 8F]|uniref:alkaline phosphatase D family protein n=1 Tax=unclassified Tsukamurella TaxID=2633480 RepID=UPI0023BA320A|nr:MULTISPECIES: alkaline phosphatase D family protein [unclassified Tsukamurella]MDF0531996.1 alkaline phosphatase D family protein [Tsukamurella sp. 8J]MDF0588895.1 alkaline phosphatase D family protein [Tsukamurella sp. 8F]